MCHNYESSETAIHLEDNLSDAVDDFRADYDEFEYGSDEIVDSARELLGAALAYVNFHERMHG